MEKWAIESSVPTVRHVPFGPIKRFSNHFGAAICAAALFGPGIANATLVGDTLTVGHYAPNTSTPSGTGSSTFQVQTGNADSYTFYNSYPWGYQVNVEASSILLDFNYLSEATTHWADRRTDASFTCLGGFPCNSWGYTETTVLFDFNGLIVSDLDDSSGNPLKGVTVETNMVGWDLSRLSFGADYVQFDWKGLTTNSDLYEWNGVDQVFDLTKSATYFNATLDFGEPVAQVPEPTSIALIGLALLGLGATRRKQKRGS